MNAGVILAGDVGSRSGLNTPKQFYKVAGKTVLEHTVDVFERHNGIDEIAVVVNSSLVREVESIILRNKWTKLKKVLIGGKERYYNQEQAVMEIMKYVDGRNRNAMVRSRYQSCAYMSLKLGIYGKNEYRNKFHLLQSVDILSNDCLNKHTNLVVWCSFHFSYRLSVFGAKAINKYHVLKNKLIEIWNLLRAVISLKRFNYSR